MQTSYNLKVIVMQCKDRKAIHNAMEIPIKPIKSKATAREETHLLTKEPRLDQRNNTANESIRAWQTKVSK